MGAFDPRWLKTDVGGGLGRLGSETTTRAAARVVNHVTGLGSVHAKYKRVADKIVPVKAGDGTKPKKEKEPEEIEPDRKGLYGKWLLPRMHGRSSGGRLNQDRIKSLRFGEILFPAEREVFIEMLKRREYALAWDFSEKGMISSEIEPPHVIRTKPHESWRDRAFRTPRKLLEVETEIVKERLQLGLFE